MVLYGDLTYDSRVRKEARSLSQAGHDVIVACLASGPAGVDLPEGVRVVVCPPSHSAVIPGSTNPFFAARGGRLSAAWRRATWFVAYARGLRAWGRSVVEACGPVDVWHAHDLTGLAAVVPHVGAVTPVVYDSHELFLEAGTATRLPGLVRGLLRKYERRLIARTVAVVTVNDEIADVLSRRYRPRRVVVVHNCPDRLSGPIDGRPLLRQAAAIPPAAPIVLYHGALTSGRGIGRLMEAMLRPGLEDAHLVLMGLGDKGAEFRDQAASIRWAGRVHVLDPVKPADLMPWVASADVGAIPNPGRTLNDRFSAPNKLFECLAAGTPVVTGDFPTLRRIVMDDPLGPLGTVCDTSRAEAIAAGLLSVLRLDRTARDELRARCSRAAAERWNWRTEAVVLTALYDEIALGLGAAADPHPTSVHRGRPA